MRSFALAVLLMLSACSSYADGPPGAGGRGMGRAPVSPAGEPLGGMAADEAAYGAVLVDWARALDSNRDGYLSAAELKPDIARFFKEVDADKDGAINSRELGDYRLARLAALRGGPGPGRPPSGGDVPPREGTPPPAGNAGPGGARGGMMGGGGEDKVMAADRNLDFRVTPAELETMALERLHAMDGNRDGNTSLEEIREAGIKAYHERPARGGPGGMGGGPRRGGDGLPGGGGGPPGGGPG